MDALIAQTQHLATHVLLQIHLEFQINFVHALTQLLMTNKALNAKSVRNFAKLAQTPLIVLLA